MGDRAKDGSERAGAGTQDGRNDVLLVGRLPAAASSRELPSGDVLVQFRLVIPRSGSGMDREVRPRAPTVDTIDCVARRRECSGASAAGKPVTWSRWRARSADASGGREEVPPAAPRSRSSGPVG